MSIRLLQSLEGQEAWDAKRLFAVHVVPPCPATGCHCHHLRMDGDDTFCAFVDFRLASDGKLKKIRCCDEARERFDEDVLRCWNRTGSLPPWPKQQGEAS